MTVKTVTTKNLIPSAKLDKAITDMGNRAANIQQDMHHVACSVLLHLGVHKDVRVVYKLLGAMPEMARTNGLRNWLVQHAPISIVQNEDGSDLITYDKARATGAGNGVKLSEGIAKPFWKFSATEGKPYQPVKVEQALGQLIQRLEKDAKEMGDKVDHTALLASLKALKVAPAVEAATGSDPLAK